MLFIHKIFFFCWITLLIFIQLGYQSKLGTESSDSTEIDLDVLEDCDCHNTTTIIDEYDGSALPDTTPKDITNSPIHSSTSTSMSSTTLHSTRSTKLSNLENTSSTTKETIIDRVNASTTDPRDEPVFKCNSDGTYDGQYDIEHWPPVLTGEISMVDCPHGDGRVLWNCIDYGYFDPKGPDFSNCTDWLDDLENMSDISFVDHLVPPFGAIQVIEFISNKTLKNNTIIKSGKLSRVLDIISKIQTFVDHAKDTNLENIEIYTKSIVKTFTHIMEQKQAWVNSTATEKAALGSKILIGTQLTSYTLSLQQNLNNSFVEINNNDFYINTFYTNSSYELIFPLNNKNCSIIIIPPNTTFVNSSVERNSTAIGVIIRNLNRYMSGDLEEHYEMNSDILSFSLTNSSKRIQLNQDVIIILKHKHRLQFGDTVNCVFWDFNQSKWSSDGCHQLVNESDLLHTVCKCNHLTNFAALMDVKGRESKTLLKSLLTYFCSVISIFGLIFTINLIIRANNNSQTLRGNLNEMRSIITCNLCICLMVTNLLVIAGMDRTDILWLCQMSSALLLYSLLSSFSWMLMEGYYLYKSLVACFNAEFKASYLYSLGYGLPIAIFIIAFLVIYIKEEILLEALFDERYSYFCWISSSHYKSHIWILIGPAVCVIVSNCFLMFISLRTAFKILRNQSSFGVNTDKTKIKFKKIISFVFLLFLLGITWLSFLFYINQFFTSFFAYVFIVLNGSQGFFIFLYYLSIYDFKGNRRTDTTSSGNSKLV